MYRHNTCVNITHNALNEDTIYTATSPFSTNGQLQYELHMTVRSNLQLFLLSIYDGMRKYIVALSTPELILLLTTNLSIDSCTLYLSFYQLQVQRLEYVRRNIYQSCSLKVCCCCWSSVSSTLIHSFLAHCLSHF